MRNKIRRKARLAVSKTHMMFEKEPGVCVRLVLSLVLLLFSLAVTSVQQNYLVKVNKRL